MKDREEGVANPEELEGMEKQLLLSIVIISRNEEKNIQRCIESVLKFTGDLNSREIILVDSASSDQTIKIAQNYPLQIYQLQPSCFLSPAAGRFLGTNLAKGKYIFFIDGDMELKPGWLQVALTRISRDGKIAGIAGQVNDLYLNSQKVVKEVKDRTGVRNQEGRANSFGGCALYRRSVLNEVGGFNPYLRTQEEKELALRIRHKGYYLWKLPLEMVDHYTHHRGSFFEMKRILNLHQYTGVGQVFRIAYENKYFWACARENFHIFHFYIYVVFSGILLPLGFYKSNFYFFLWLATTLSYLVMLSLKRHSVGEAFASCIAKFCYGLTFFRDFLRRPRRPEEYYPDFKTIQ